MQSNEFQSVAIIGRDSSVPSGGGDRCECDKECRDQVMEHNIENYSTACEPVFDAPSSLPSPPNDVGFNLMVGRDAAPSAVNPTTRKRNHVGAIVIFTKQFHRVPGWGFAI
jgi:hypothetical protein